MQNLSFTIGNEVEDGRGVLRYLLGIVVLAYHPGVSKIAGALPINKQTLEVVMRLSHSRV